MLRSDVKKLGGHRYPSSANSRKLLAAQRIPHAVPTYARPQADKPRRVVDHFANHLRLASVCALAHPGQHTVRVRVWDDRQEPAFVGDIERVEPEELADAAHRLAYRDGLLLDHDPHAGPSCDLAEYRPHAAPRRVAQAVDLGF